MKNEPHGTRSPDEKREMGGRKRLEADTIEKFSFLSELQLSPSGEQAAFYVTTANGENGYDHSLYLHHPKRGICKLAGLGVKKPFLWLDEERLLFPAVRTQKDKTALADKEPYTHFYELSLQGGEAEEAFCIPLSVTAIKKVGEGRFLLTALYDPACPSTQDMTPAEKEAHRQSTRYDRDYQFVDELPYWSNGAGFTNKKRSRLYLYTAKGAELTPITEPLAQVGEVKLSDNKRVAFYTMRNFTQVLGRKDTLCSYDLETGEKRTLLDGIYSIDAFAPWRDGVVFAGSTQERYGMNENPHFYLYDIKSGQVSLLLERDDGLGDGVGSDCRLGGGNTFLVEGDALYYTMFKGYEANLYRLELCGGENLQLTHCKGSVDFFDVKGERLVAVAMEGLRLQELYAVEKGELVRLSDLNEGFYTDYALSRPEHLSFVEADGFSIDGWVLKPVGYEEGKSYPAILDIHGGPRAGFGEVFFHEMQYWAACGYFVLFCNPRGSSGKGNDFAEVRGSYGTYDYDNLMQFTDEALKKYPDMDPNRLAVTGGSYGGFMTNWIIGHTNRFRVAASQRSISNWVSFGYTSDIGYYFGRDQMAADPWSDVEKLWWHSPLKYADKVTTPTLFIHSDEDYRCWIAEGYQMFSALKLHGVKTQMWVFHGENHELSRSGKPEHRVKRLHEITQWIASHINPSPEQ